MIPSSLCLKLFVFDEQLAKFTSIFQVFDLPCFLRHRPPYILGDCKTCFHPFSLSLSLSYPPRIASVYRFVRNRDKSVLFDRRAKSPPPTFIIIRIPSFEGRQMRRLEGIKLAIVAWRFDSCWNQCSRGRWKVNGIGGAFWTRVNSTRSRELDSVLQGRRSCLLLLLVFFSLSFGRKWSDNGD